MSRMRFLEWAVVQASFGAVCAGISNVLLEIDLDLTKYRPSHQASLALRKLVITIEPG